ncbi:MAG: hypothetical protein H6861_00380 [Rhodospirillales bacterium]|nr:hypothetical protein [Rhodospirillales bacterium]
MKLKSSQNAKRKPDFTARIQNDPTDTKSGFVTIGAAWRRDEGGLYIRLTGKQLVDAPIYLFANES